MLKAVVVGGATSALSMAIAGSIVRAADFQIIGPGLASDVSADGSVVVGNTDLNYETFRWTSATGIVPLGRATVPVITTGAGVPEVSADGTRISATIIDDTNTMGTPGLWTLGLGWQQLMPPGPADAEPLDLYHGSSWGISGDGNSVVGLYWRSQPGGLAHAMKWTSPTGAADLGSGGESSRANGANYDGSVVVGWDEEPTARNWQAAVWVNGVRAILTTNDAFCSAEAVTPNGTTIVGNSYDTVSGVPDAAIWRWNGTGWDEQQLGVLPGTDPIFGGNSVASDVSGDGSIVVGWNQFDFFGGTGFIWTQDLGLMSATDWLTASGVALDPDFAVANLTGVSQDGSTVVGYGYDVNSGEYSSFIVTVPEPASALAALALCGAGIFSRRRSSIRSA